MGTTSYPNLESFEIVQVGTGTFPVATANYNNSQATSSATTTIAHNLGYTPAVLAFFVIGNNFTPLPYTSMGISSSTIGNWIFVSYSVEVDSTNVYLLTQVTASGTTSGNGSASPLYMKYYLLREHAS